MENDNIETPALQRVPIGEIAPEVLRRGGAITFIATGNSMWPHIRHGDTLIAEPLPAGCEPRTGWVIIYHAAHGRLAAHRVVGTAASGSYKVRGDASTGDPELVPRSSVLGRVVKREGRGKNADLTSAAREIEGRLIARSGRARILLERFLRAAMTPVTTHRRGSG